MARDFEPLRDVYNPQSPTTARDRFFSAMFQEVFHSKSPGGPAAGDNFWVWSGNRGGGTTGWGIPRMKFPDGIRFMIRMNQLMGSSPLMHERWQIPRNEKIIKL